MDSKPKKSNKKLILILLLVTTGMFGFGYALVPFYNFICDVTGLNGKTGGRVETVSIPLPEDIDKSRDVAIQFTVTANEQLPWEFRPNITSVAVHPGEMQSVSYYAKNLSDHKMTVQAIPSVSPGEAATYLKKIVCFCFNQQSLDAQAEQNMAVQFYIDKSLPKRIETLTLSYTLFDTTDN